MKSFISDAISVLLVMGVPVVVVHLVFDALGWVDEISILGYALWGAVMLWTFIELRRERS